MDSKGLFSEPFIFEGTMKSDLYLKKYLKKRLIPFIKKNYPNNKILFWPDLSTTHYAKQCISYLEQEKINFVKKEENPPNVPQARPIEKYWAICKQRYSQRHYPAKSLSSFKRIWKNIASKVQYECGKTLVANIKQKLRLIDRQGVFSTFKTK